ncbi:hypothetical protein [Caldimonas tepidiphila]|uniref:hypothetical protein n=1 Tax=Caldimonas tepidiphila TaxID=2315841 RepID=UPI000E5C4F1E|nr:hypothetical protein [Caldimonas tepidiphila]
MGIGLSIGRGLLALALSLAASTSAADLHVIVHAANPVRALSQKEAVDLFMGRTRAFAGGDFALPFDLPRDDAVRARFYRALVGMSPAQLNSYWARLMFSGQTLPPQSLPNEAVMLDMVRRNPSAIGYLTTAPTDAGVRTVLVLKEAP